MAQARQHARHPPTFLVIGMLLVMFEFIKQVFPIPFVELTVLQWALALVTVAYAVRIGPRIRLSGRRLKRRPLEGEIFACRAPPILALIFHAIFIAITVQAVSILQDPSLSLEAKGNCALFLVLLAFPAVATLSLIATRDVVARDRACHRGRLFAKEFLTRIPLSRDG